MRRFEFYSPGSLGEALRFLSEKGERAKVVAGGTDLVPRLRDGVSQPEFVLNVLEVGELNGIKEADRVLHIGATTTTNRMVGTNMNFQNSMASFPLPYVFRRGCTLEVCTPCTHGAINS